jgi:hypothetical protein
VVCISVFAASILISVHLGFHFFFNDLCPGLLDIHPAELSTSKGIKLLVIGLYLGFRAFPSLFLAAQQAFQYLFHLASVLLNQSYPLQLIWSTKSHF